MLVFPKQPVGRVAEAGGGASRVRHPFTPVGTCEREGIGCGLSHKQGVVAVVRRGSRRPPAPSASAEETSFKGKKNHTSRKNIVSMR